MKATSPGPPMLPSRAGACRSAQRRTPTRWLPLSALLTAEAIPSALGIGAARQISVPIIVLPSCTIRLTPPSPATPARTTRACPQGMLTPVRQAVIRPRPHLAGPNETQQLQSHAAHAEQPPAQVFFRRTPP